MKSVKSQKKVKVKKNLLMDLINQEKRSKEEEESESLNSTQLNNLKIFTPNIDRSHAQSREEINNAETLFVRPGNLTDSTLKPSNLFF